MANMKVVALREVNEGTKRYKLGTEFELPIERAKKLIELDMVAESKNVGEADKSVRGRR